MRIFHATVVVGVSALGLATVGGCGADRTIHTRGASTLVASGPRAVLQSLVDLPEGFSDRARSGWRPPFRPRVRACRTLFDAAAGKPPRDGLLGTTSATYEGEHVGELAGVGLATYAGDGAAAHLGELREAMSRCVTADGGAPGAGSRLSASRLPLGYVGQDAEGRRLTGRVAGYPYEMHLVVLSAGHTLIALVHAGLNPPDASRTAELTRVLARKVGNLEP
ncbi:hypothetical protein N5079_22485 [Planotetraspora sp. A-T 1434]|uniref:hypothetical protein n=1 Tax=Planotetraspora sp. A-T 1434 TaxID=2979219 RepID=UPI0021C19833|nr:hypothetical protein [Planotetraspora sp. A-T 1434]MCT9932980.1 hypothetical protein [Planotetraspora sp. A-T 1434]